jgi:hypothetical protein
MNTNNKQDRKNQGQRAAEKQKPKKQGRSQDQTFHEQERPETRMFR